MDGSGERDSEVERLLALAHDKSQAGRSALYSAIGELFGRRGSELSETERRMMAEILRQLGRDVEMAVRRVLAQRIAGWPHAPHELVLELANDGIEVAAPLLRDSPVLRDPDLIEVIRQQTQQHQLAVAMRRGQPAEPEAAELKRLVQMYDAITPQAAERILRRWRLDPDYLDAIRMVGGGPNES